MASSNDIAGAWLSEFAISLASGDISSVTQSFLPQGWLRDVLVLSWSTRSLGGHSQISKYLSEHLPNSTITDVKLDERDHLKPEEYTLSPSISGVAAAFTFETSLFLGRGYFRLLEDSTTAKWKALSVFIVADDLKGYEERGYHRGIFEGHTLAWEEAEKKTRARVENDPQVVISMLIYFISISFSYEHDVYSRGWTDWSSSRSTVQTDEYSHRRARE